MPNAFGKQQLSTWFHPGQTEALHIGGALGLTVLALFSIFYGLGGHGFINSNEALYVELAREMSETGHWAVPTLNGVPYLEKPPLFAWLLALGYYLAQALEITSIEFAVRLVTASATLVLVAMVCHFSALWRLSRAGITAGIVLSTSLGINVMSRVAMPDMLLTLLFSAALFCIPLAIHRQSRFWWRVAAACTGAAAMVKGPVAMALVLLIVTCTFIAIPQWRSEMLRLLRDLWAPALMVLPMASWLAAAELQQPGSAWYFIFNEQILRFLGQREPRDYYTGSIFYYLPRLFLFLFPWAGVLAFGWLSERRSARQGYPPVLRFLWLCAGVPFVFFSLSSAKANYYILLCVPPMAILAAHFMRPLSEGRNRILLALAVSIPVAVLVLIWSYRMWARVHGKTPALLPQPDGSMHLTMAVIMAITVMILTMVQLGWRRLAVASLGALIFPISLEMDHIVARAEPYLSARVMADYIQNHYAHETVYLYQDFEAFGALPVYLRRRVPIVDSKSSDLAYGRGVFLGSPIFYSVQEVLGAGAPSLVIVLQSREPAFKQSGLAEKSTSVISVGNAHLYRLDLHKND